MIFSNFSKNLFKTKLQNSSGFKTLRIIQMNQEITLAATFALIAFLIESTDSKVPFPYSKNFYFFKNYFRVSA